MHLRKIIISIMLIQLFAGISLLKATGTFLNPIKDAPSADPWVIQKDGFYYLLVTTSKSVWIHKSNKLETVGRAPRIKVWTAPDGDIIDKTWAPELHYLNGRWYVYTCGNIATDGSTKMRMIVLEGDTQDAQKPYTYVSMFIPNQMAIDASIWQDPETNKIYMAWSQWAPDQSIYIAEMLTPTTLGSVTVKLSEPTAAWEKKGWNVNEGPAFIKRNNKLHIIFSVSGCSTPDYGLARLTCSNGNYLNAASWTKHNELVFARHEENKVWGVGHHGFAKSPDGSEDWLVYHAKLSQTDMNEDRCTRIQPFTWDENDNPVFGEPYPTDIPLPVPYDGTGTKQTITFDMIPDKTTGDGTFHLAANASSGLPVSFGLQSGPATLTNGTIQLTGKPGTVRVYATQPGSTNYCAAWPVFREFKVSGAVTSGKGNGLTGTYYNGKNLDVKMIERIDPVINFAWSTDSPVSGVNADNFSVQWKGYILPLYSEVYRFSIISDNGRKLTVNNTVIIDQLRDDAGKEYVGSIYLEAGKKYHIELTYYETTGTANIKLNWWSNSQTKQIVPMSQLYTSLTEDPSSVKKILANNELRVFPNPAKDMLYLEGIEVEQIKQLTLMTLDGIRVAESHKTNTLIFAGIPSGNYIMKVETNGSGTGFKKVIILK